MLLALALIGGCQDPGSVAGEPFRFQVVTFNTGTTQGLAHDAAPDDGYSSAEADLSDLWYGDGLAWSPVVEDTTAFFLEQQPDIVAFQEIFWSGTCSEIPAEAQRGFFCEGWTLGDPTVAQVILSEGYQVACHPGKPDKCLAVKRDFGQIRGCEQDLCLEGLQGTTIDGCGSGARVARAVVDVRNGTELTVVNVHGSSGIEPQDQACRVRQFEQIFVDMDGQPGANGGINLVLGDLNTDPARSASFDESAAYIADIGNTAPFVFHTEATAAAEPTYQGLLNIDHVISDGLVGGCVAAGNDGLAAVSEVRYFDHLPVICDLSLRE